MYPVKKNLMPQRRLRGLPPFCLLLAVGALLSPTPAAAQASVIIPVNSRAVRFSPGNWAGNAGRGGSEYRITWNNGAYCVWHWHSTASNPIATLEISNSTAGSAISYFIDGAFYDDVTVPESGGVPIHGVAGKGDHSLIVYTRDSRQDARWNEQNAFKITGLTLDGQSAPTDLPATRPWVEIVGDSITEGILANNGKDSNLSDYSFLVGQGLMQAGYDYGVSACGYSGWLRPGDAVEDVPAYYAVTGSTKGQGGTYDDAKSRWSKIDDATSLLDSRGHISGYGGLGQEPSAIIINYGVNDAAAVASTSDVQASVTQCIAALREAAPQARIMILNPPGLASTTIYPDGDQYIAALRDGVAAYREAHPDDKRVSWVDLGQNVANALSSAPYGAGVHPNAAGHAYLAPLVLQAILKTIPASDSLKKQEEPGTSVHGAYLDPTIAIADHQPLAKADK